MLASLCSDEHCISITAPALFYLPPSLAVACSFFKRHPCRPTYFFAAAKKSRQKRPLLKKFLTAQKKAYFRVVPNTSKLVNYTSLMINTQTRRLDNCSCIVLLSAVHGGRLSSCSTGRSRASKNSSFTHAICP